MRALGEALLLRIISIISHRAPKGLATYPHPLRCGMSFTWRSRAWSPPPPPRCACSATTRTRREPVAGVFPSERQTLLASARLRPAVP